MYNNGAYFDWNYLKLQIAVTIPYVIYFRKSFSVNDLTYL